MSRPSFSCRSRRIVLNCRFDYFSLSWYCAARRRPGRHKDIAFGRCPGLAGLEYQPEPYLGIDCRVGPNHHHGTRNMSGSLHVGFSDGAGVLGSCSTAAEFELMLFIDAEIESVCVRVCLVRKIRSTGQTNVFRNHGDPGRVNSSDFGISFGGRRGGWSNVTDSLGNVWKGDKFSQNVVEILQSIQRHTKWWNLWNHQALPSIAV